MTAISASQRKRQVAPPSPAVDQMTGTTDKPAEILAGVASNEGTDAVFAAVAHRLYEERRRRDRVMADHGSLFGEPSWDILLDLFISLGASRQVSVSSACLAARVAQSTALRYVGELELAGLVFRSPDPHDGRRSHIALTGIGLTRMRDYLAGVG
ncbi:MarR family winged helix-turn-helix transcriptional regulator [Sphingomonas faeni]|uniref:MarR family winged helix-turn-helix transcriptional regulator n=1 Tax=Sphingomonas faeni TaxID=185950 RepID=UPI00335F1F07